MKRVAGVSIFGLLLAALFGVFIGVSAYTFNYAEGLSYMSNDPKACVNCHVMRDQFDAWQKMPHHAVAMCNDCHVPHDVVGKYATKIEHGYRHSKGFTFQDFHEPIQITERDRKIVENNCVRCHGEFVAEITGHMANPADEVSCSRCHSDVGHGPKR
jgi:cytochrome c nitrite reductase small subunit